MNKLTKTEEKILGLIAKANNLGALAGGPAPTWNYEGQDGRFYKRLHEAGRILYKKTARHGMGWVLAETVLTEDGAPQRK